MDCGPHWRSNFSDRLRQRRAMASSCVLTSVSTRLMRLAQFNGHSDGSG